MPEDGSTRNSLHTPRKQSVITASGHRRGLPFFPGVSSGLQILEHKILTRFPQARTSQPLQTRYTSTSQLFEVRESLPP